MIKRNILVRLALFGGAALALTACSGGGGSSGGPPPLSRLEDFFGTQFGVLFRQGPNTVPTKPTSTDIIPLTLTALPKPLH